LYLMPGLDKVNTHNQRLAREAGTEPMRYIPTRREPYDPSPERVAAVARRRDAHALRERGYG
ncbi:MAG: hypothetical protein ACYC4B_32425, partial [Pirellulaceae bacterium]